MAVQSGMNYGEVDNLVKFLDNKKEEIIAVFEELQTSTPSRIAAAYDGNAAEAYKQTLAAQSKKMSETIDTMIASLKQETAQQQADYQAQDQRMQNSIEAARGN